MDQLRETSSTIGESVIPPREPLRTLLRLARDGPFHAGTRTRHDQSYVQLELVKEGTYETHPAMFVLFKVILALRQMDQFTFDISFTTPKPNVVMKVKQRRPAPAPAGKRSIRSLRSGSRKTMAVGQQTHLRRSVLKGQIYERLDHYKNELLLGHSTPFEAGQPVVVAAGPRSITGRTSNVSRETEWHVNLEPSIPTPYGTGKLGNVEETFREVHPNTPGGAITTTIHQWGLRVNLSAAHVEGWQYPREFPVGVVLQHTGPVDVLVLPALSLVERLKPELAIIHRLKDDMQGSRYPTCSHTSPRSKSCDDTCREFNHLHMSDLIWRHYLTAHWLKDWNLLSNIDGWVQYSHRTFPPRRIRSTNKEEPEEHPNKDKPENPDTDGAENSNKDKLENPNTDGAENSYKDQTEKTNTGCLIA